MKSTSSSKQHLSVSSMTLTAAVTAVICILAPIALPIPVSPVPLSLGSFVIMLAGCILGWKLGLVSCLLYLALGILGLPVFSAYGSGLAKVVGPTGGYLLGYIPLVILTGLIFEKISFRSLQIILIGAATVVVLYLPGTLWLAWQAHLTFSEALMMGVLPYIPGDIVKIILVVAAGSALRKRLASAGLLPGTGK